MCGKQKEIVGSGPRCVSVMQGSARASPSVCAETKHAINSAEYGATMKNFPTTDNRLMVRDQRLQEAYRQIIFIADHGFNQDPKYKRANQVLYARIKRLEETGDFERPRLVSDVIPESNLAKYGNYQYNETRERTYTATNEFPRIHLPCPRHLKIHQSQHLRPTNDTHNHAHNHPHATPNGSHTPSSHAFNITNAGLNHAHTATNPFGKLSPAQASNSNTHKLPNHAKIPPKPNTREIWMLPEVEQIFVHILFTNSFNFNLYEVELERFEDKIEAVEEGGGVEGCCNGDFHQVTPVLGHLFDRTPGRLCGFSVSREDFVGTLPYYFNVKEYEDVLLRKRILSDVVRELWSRPKLENYEKSMKIHKSSLENVLVEEENFKYPNALKLVDTDKSLQVLVNSMCFMNEKLKKLDALTAAHRAPKKPEKPQQPEAGAPPAPAKRLYSDVVQGNNKTKTALPEPGKQEKIAAVTSSFVSLDTSTASSTTSGALEETEVEKVKYSYSEVVNGNGSGTNLVFLNEFTNERNFQSCYTPVQYLPQNYRFGGYQVPQQNPAGSAVPQPWLYRPTNICNYGSFLGQILVPQMPTKHRWNPGFQTRTQNPAPVFQAPVVFSGTQTPPQAGKKKTAAATAQKFSKKKQPAKSCKSQSSEMKISRTGGGEEEGPLFPVGCSASEELERIALREYQQSSEEIFFREIERQAEEQYDGNPENSPRPPIRAMLGGLAVHFCFLLRFIDSFVSTFSVSRIRRQLY